MVPYYSLLRSFQLLFGFCLVVNTMITVVYWTVLHKQVVESRVKRHGEFFRVTTTLHHSFPLIVSIFEVILSKHDFVYSDVFYMMIIGHAYTLNNFLQTKLIPSRVPYPFLKYEDYDSIVVLLFFTVANTIFYITIVTILKILFNSI